MTSRTEPAFRPEYKIILYVVFIFSLFFYEDPVFYLGVAVLLFVVSLVVPFRKLKAGWIPISIFLVFTFVSNVLGRPGRIVISSGFLTITEEGIRVAAIRTLRVLFMIVGAKAMMASSNPEEVVAALGRLLSPLERLRLPVRDFFHTMGLTIACFPILKNMVAETYRENIKTAEAKGFWERAKVISAFLMPMFVRSIRTPEAFFEKAGKGDSARDVGV